MRRNNFVLAPLVLALLAGCNSNFFALGECTGGYIHGPNGETDYQQALAATHRYCDQFPGEQETACFFKQTGDWRPPVCDESTSSWATIYDAKGRNVGTVEYHGY